MNDVTPVTVTLNYPIQFGDELITELKFTRRVRLSDMAENAVGGMLLPSSVGMKFLQSTSTSSPSANACKAYSLASAFAFNTVFLSRESSEGGVVLFRLSIIARNPFGSSWMASPIVFTFPFASVSHGSSSALSASSFCLGSK